MKLKEEGFYGLIEQFKDGIYSTFVKNGGFREINSNNIAWEHDSVWEYHISMEEEVVQVILFYHSLVEAIGYLPDFCYDIVNRYVAKYNEIDLSNTLSASEQNDLHAIVSKLLLQMH